MEFFELKYFAKGNGISGSMFDAKDKIVKINLEFLSSLSNLETFSLPLSGERTDHKYAIVSMSNGDQYYIRESSHKEINDKIGGKLDFTEDEVSDLLGVVMDNFMVWNEDDDTWLHKESQAAYTTKELIAGYAKEIGK